MTSAPQQHEAPRTVVLGGTAGIGLATASLLAAQGHAVTVVGRDPERVKQALAGIDSRSADSLSANSPSANSLSVQGRTADITDRSSLNALFAGLGPIDHLVVTAPGTGSVGALAELDLSLLGEAFASKFTAYAHAIQAALPHLDRAGSITLVSAASAQAALPGTAGLAAVNGAVETVVPVLALELAPIRVNAVSPGVVDTDWWTRVGLSGEQRAAAFAQMAGSIPVGRVGRPEEIADAISLLVRNNFMTGTVIPVDGGARLKP